jgi:hypothetical protein
MRVCHKIEDAIFNGIDLSDDTILEKTLFQVSAELYRRHVLSFKDYDTTNCKACVNCGRLDISIIYNPKTNKRRLLCEHCKKEFI